MLGRVRSQIVAYDKRFAYWLASPKERLLGTTEEVALTFDDGPDPIYTPKVLDVLARRSVPATFFLVGERIQRYPELVRRIVDEGHSVGSHSHSHPDMWTISSAELRQQYVEGMKALHETTGRHSALVRPPKGWLDLRTAIVFRRLGMEPILWNLSGNDWEVGVTPSAILDAIGTPTGGDVILLHDAIERPVEPSTVDRTATVEALDPLIDRVAASGLRFGRVAASKIS